MAFDPGLDLEINRLLKAPPAKVWRCWTEAELLVKWFTPPPVVTREAVIELYPGGLFRTVMVFPDGAEHAGDGAVLDVVHERKFVFTDCLGPGFRPVSGEKLGFTGMILLEPEGSGTRYVARAIHGDRATRDSHEKMGFSEGWGMVAGQLDAFAQTLPD